jgi:hypothetical protein
MRAKDYAWPMGNMQKLLFLLGLYPRKHQALVTSYQFLNRVKSAILTLTICFGNIFTMSLFGNSHKMPNTILGLDIDESQINLAELTGLNKTATLTNQSSIPYNT